MAWLSIAWELVKAVFKAIFNLKDKPPDPVQQGRDQQRTEDELEAQRKAYEAELAIQEAERKAEEDAKKPHGPVGPGTDIFNP